VPTNLSPAVRWKIRPAIGSAVASRLLSILRLVLPPMPWFLSLSGRGECPGLFRG
jgi:hypothetical protein